MNGERFGRMLKEERGRAGRSMGEVARYLNVSVTYISDVERGVRTPFTPERVMQFASFLKIPPERTEALLREAAACRGAFELGIEGAGIREKHAEVGAALMRGWNSLSDQDLEQIKDILAGRHTTDERRSSNLEESH
jgi:transcriptional regulator with XRE-family HTH domain